MKKSARKRIVILGSTGSVGTSALEVIRAMPERFEVVALSACSRWRALAGQIREFSPRVAALVDTGYRQGLEEAVGRTRTELLWGEEGVCEVARWPEADLVLSAITGGAGLPAALGALEAGHSLALANKEALVMGGGLLKQLASENGAEVIPVDSEHSAIWQAMRSGSPTEVARVIITASGGPFYGMSEEELREVTPDQALAHPTWHMGKKVTIDSATMMNKALEIIEARWLFELSADKIKVLIHPQSIVHSMVEFVDGSVVAQLAVPDMKLPIQYAFTFPEHVAGPVSRLDLAQVARLDFAEASPEKFPSLELGYRVVQTGGTSGAVLNAANEAAVAAFLKGRMKFTDIVSHVKRVLDRCEDDTVQAPALEDIVCADRRAREEAEACLARS